MAPHTHIFTPLYSLLRHDFSVFVTRRGGEGIFGGGGAPGVGRGRGMESGSRVD